MQQNKSSLRRATLFALPALALAALPVYAGRGLQTPPVRFTEHIIDTIPGAYHATVADINGDGKPDIIAISETENQIAWYENPTWEKHIITKSLARNIDVTAFDLKKTGKPCLFIASEFDMGHSKTGGRIAMLVPGADVRAQWTVREVGLDPTAHRIRWADWDGNGHKELVVTPIVGVGAQSPDWSEPVEIQSYRFTGFNKPDGIERIEMHPVDRSLHMSHGVCVCDFDGDHRDDLLVASFEGITWFKPQGRGASRTWLKTHLAEGHPSDNPAGRGCSEIDRGWLKGKRPFLATIEPWHGNEVVVYLPPIKGSGSSLWSRHVIDSTIVDGHALECVDLDGDGQSEIIAGGRGGTYNLYCYRCIDHEGLKWERSIIDEGHMSSAGVVAADIFGTGRLDLVAVARVSGQVKLYENLGK